MPVTTFASAIGYSFPVKYTIIFDIACSLGGIIGDIYIVWKYTTETAGLILGYVTPAFVFAPIILYSVIIIWRIVSKRPNDNSITYANDFGIPSNALLD